jgi:hypothetical protein
MRKRTVTLNNLPVLAKVLAIVVILAAFMTGISGLAINALGTLNETAQDIDRAGDERTLASQMIGNIMAIVTLPLALAYVLPRFG